MSLVYEISRKKKHIWALSRRNVYLWISLYIFDVHSRKETHFFTNVNLISRKTFSNPYFFPHSEKKYMKISRNTLTYQFESYPGKKNIPPLGATLHNVSFVFCLGGQTLVTTGWVSVTLQLNSLQEHYLESLIKVNDKNQSPNPGDPEEVPRAPHPGAPSFCKNQSF